MNTSQKKNWNRSQSCIPYFSHYSCFHFLWSCQNMSNCQKFIKTVKKWHFHRKITYKPIYSFLSLWKNLYSFYILNWKCTFCHLVTRGFPPFFSKAQFTWQTFDFFPRIHLMFLWMCFCDVRVTWWPSFFWSWCHLVVL